MIVQTRNQRRRRKPNGPPAPPIRFCARCRRRLTRKQVMNQCFLCPGRCKRDDLRERKEHRASKACRLCGRPPFGSEAAAAKLHKELVAAASALLHRIEETKGVSKERKALIAVLAKVKRSQVNGSKKRRRRKDSQSQSR